MYRPNLKSVPEITPNIGEEEAVGGRGDTFRKSVGDFLKALHSNFFSIFTRFRDIAAFVLQHVTLQHVSPTSSLPKISPCSPGSKWVHGLWATTSECVGLLSV